MNLKEHVPAFVKTYYTHVLQSPREVKKFYSGDATFFRSYMNSSSSQPVIPEQVCPRISQNSTITIKNYVSAPIPRTSSISVTVYGNIKSDKKNSCFSQYFILQEIGERICVVSDIYNEFNEADLAQPNSQQQQQQSQPQQQPQQPQQQPQQPQQQQSQPQQQPQQQATTTNNAPPPANNNYNQNRNQRNKKKKNNFVYTPE